MRVLLIALLAAISYAQTVLDGDCIDGYKKVLDDGFYQGFITFTMHSGSCDTFCTSERESGNLCWGYRAQDSGSGCWIYRTDPTQTESIQPASGRFVYAHCVTEKPTLDPTMAPTIDPTFAPSSSPSVHPTSNPSGSPTTSPSFQPSFTDPSVRPSIAPSAFPSLAPTLPTVTQEVTLQGNCTDVMQNENYFLQRCSELYSGVICISVRCGSIIVTLSGKQLDVDNAVSDIQNSGMEFSPFTIWEPLQTEDANICTSPKSVFLTDWFPAGDQTQSDIEDYLEYVVLGVYGFVIFACLVVLFFADAENEFGCKMKYHFMCTRKLATLWLIILIPQILLIVYLYLPLGEDMGAYDAFYLAQITTSTLGLSFPSRDALDRPDRSYIVISSVVILHTLLTGCAVYSMTQPGVLQAAYLKRNRQSCCAKLMIIPTWAIYGFLFGTIMRYLESLEECRQDDWDIFQTYHFVVSSITTVGFGDLRPNTRSGQLAFSLLIWPMLWLSWRVVSQVALPIVYTVVSVCFRVRTSQGAVPNSISSLMESRWTPRICFRCRCCGKRNYQEAEKDHNLQVELRERMKSRNSLSPNKLMLSRNDTGSEDLVVAYPGAVGSDTSGDVMSETEDDFQPGSMRSYTGERSAQTIELQDVLAKRRMPGMVSESSM